MPTAEQVKSNGKYSLVPLIEGFGSCMEGLTADKNNNNLRVVTHVTEIVTDPEGKPILHEGKEQERIYDAHSFRLKVNTEGHLPFAFREHSIMDPCRAPHGSVNWEVGGNIHPQSEENRKQNTSLISGRKNRWNFEKKKVAVICGGGPSLEKHVDSPAIKALREDPDVAFVTTSLSQRLIEGDYHLSAEGAPAAEGRLDGVETKNTVGILCSKVHPYYAKLPWKSVRWYTHMGDGPDGCEMFWTHRTVMYDAIQFAARHLGAQHIVFLGCDGAAPAKDPRYHKQDKAPIDFRQAWMTPGLDGEMYMVEPVMFQIMQATEACAWLLRQRQRTVWNCSEAGIMQRNMLVTSLENFADYWQRNK